MSLRIFLAILVATLACGEIEETPDKPAAKSYLPSMDVNIVGYEDFSEGGRNRFVARAVLVTDKIPDPGIVEHVARAIWNKRGEGWDDFTVLVYLQGMNTNAAAWGTGEFSRDAPPKFSTDEKALLNTKYWAQTEQAQKKGS
jgi:hypothetical protein